MFQKGILLSILSARKTPTLLRLFEKAGGDLQISQNKNYAKDPRHLVLLNGYRSLIKFIYLLIHISERFIVKYRKNVF